VSFRKELEQCERVIDASKGDASGLNWGGKWYRPPNGVMNRVMRKVLIEEGYRVALGDCYSADPQIPDPDFHTKLLTGCAEDGSMLILHSPEPGIRHKTLQVLDILVRNLRSKFGRVEFVTIGGMFPATEPAAGTGTGLSGGFLYDLSGILICLMVALPLCGVAYGVWRLLRQCSSSVRREHAPRLLGNQCGSAGLCLTGAAVTSLVLPYST